MHERYRKERIVSWGCGRTYVVKAFTSATSEHCNVKLERLE